MTCWPATTQGQESRHFAGWIINCVDGYFKTPPVKGGKIISLISRNSCRYLFLSTGFMSTMRKNEFPNHHASSCHISYINLYKWTIVFTHTLTFDSLLNHFSHNLMIYLFLCLNYLEIAWKTESDCVSFKANCAWCAEVIYLYSHHSYRNMFIFT